jgi:hypothetical protein
MENNNTKKQNVYISEEEKTLIGMRFKTHLKKHLVVKFIIVGCKKFL